MPTRKLTLKNTVAAGLSSLMCLTALVIQLDMRSDKMTLESYGDTIQLKTDKMMIATTYLLALGMLGLATSALNFTVSRCNLFKSATKPDLLLPAQNGEKNITSIGTYPVEAGDDAESGIPASQIEVGYFLIDGSYKLAVRPIQNDSDEPIEWRTHEHYESNEKPTEQTIVDNTQLMEKLRALAATPPTILNPINVD